MSTAPTGTPDGGPGLILTGLLEDLRRRVPHVRGVLLLSPAGLVEAACGLGRDTADQMAALASGLYSLARSSGARLSGGSAVRQVAVELEGALLLVVRSSGVRLAVLAGAEVDAAALGRELADLAGRAHSYLTVPT